MSRINTKAHSAEAVMLAEQARVYYYAVATSDDRTIANGDSPTYRAAHRAFLAAIKAAWPHMDARRLFEHWLDSNESMSYYIREIERDGRYLM